MRRAVLVLTVVAGCLGAWRWSIIVRSQKDPREVVGDQ